MSDQNDAIRHRGSAARLVAGPGTGKTQTLIDRADYLVRDAGIDPERVLILTFTDATGRELRKRLASIDPPLPGIPDARTLHSYSFKQLRRQTGSEFVGQIILDPWEVRHLLCEDLAPRISRTPAQAAAILLEYDAAWRTLDEPPSSAFRSRFESVVETLREVYTFALLGELVYKFKRLMDNNPDFRPQLDHLLVDEYQDLNSCDLAVIKELVARSGCELFAVGDDDQCIYRFRQADPSGIRRFGRDYPGSQDFESVTCYRCGRPILQTGLRLMEHEEGRLEKHIEAASDEGHVRILAFRSPAAERRGVTEMVSQHRQSGTLPGEILVLVPRRNMAASYVEALNDAGFPAENAAEPGSFLDSEGVRRFFYAIRYAANNEDPVAVRGWLACTPRIGPVAIGQLIDVCVETHKPFVEVCRETTNRLVMAAIRELEELSERIEDQGQFEAELDRLTEELALTDATRERLIGLAMQLRSPEAEPDESLEGMAEPAPEESDSGPEEPPAVRVTTFRKAKGLSADVVIVTDMDDDLVPGDAEDVAEQRRLVYVSLTRARRFLYVTHVQTRYDRTRYAGAGHRAPGPQRQRSRFLNEIDLPSESWEGGL